MKFIFSPFFGYIIKFLHVACKITNPSHDDIYLRIFVKIFSEGRRQDFSSDHKVFPNQPKKFRMLQMTTSIWEFLYIFSRKDVGRKNFHFLPTTIGVKSFNFTMKDVSRRIQTIIGSIPHRGGLGWREPPQGVDPLPFWSSTPASDSAPLGVDYK